MRQLALAAIVICASLLVWSRPHHVELPDDAVPAAGETLAVADAPGSIDELRTRIAAILEREHVPGAAIALVGRDGPIWVGGIGVRDLATGAPVEADTAFRVGSLSKSVIALGVMRLVDQGKLDLDRPLREILPGLIDNPWEAEAPVTLAHLMEHTAGLDDVRPNEVFTEDEGLSVEAALALNPRSRIVRWRPGTRHAYANGGYTIAARAIEVATGEPFDAYLRREILAPMGIHDADFRRTDALAARLATGYNDLAKPAVFRPFAHRPSASLLISANELAKLVQFWIRRGDGFPPIVSRAGLARIERNGTLPYAPLATDYGFANYGDVQHPVFSRGHDGGMPGFHANFRYFPEHGIGYVMLLNAAYSFRGYFEIRSLLFSYLARGHAITQPAVGTPSERPGAGYFRFASPRSSLFAFVDHVRLGWRVTDLPDDGIRLRDLQGHTVDLVPTADGGFRLPNECGSSMRFTTNSEGTPVLVMSFLYAEGSSYWIARVRYVALELAMWLVNIVPVWAVLALVAGAIRRRRVLPIGMIAWPALASTCCALFLPLLLACFDEGVIGIVHPLTVGLCAMSIAFPVAAAASLYCSLRHCFRPDRPSWLVRAVPTACSLALAALALWFTANGLAGFRTWAW